MRTPHLRSLSKRPNSVVLDNFHAQYSSCSPTRSAVLTGRHPFRDYVNDANGKSPVPNPLPAHHWSLGKSLQEAEVRTLHLGKWHLGDFHVYKGVTEDQLVTPTEHGFDTWTASKESLPGVFPISECMQEPVMGKTRVKYYKKVGRRNCGKNLLQHYFTNGNLTTRAFKTAYPAFYSKYYAKKALTSYPLWTEEITDHQGSDVGFLVDRFLAFHTSLAPLGRYYANLRIHDPHSPIPYY